MRATQRRHKRQIRLPRIDPAVVAAEGRLLDAVADGTLLVGTATELAERLGVSARAFESAVRELAKVWWISASTSTDGRLHVGWEDRAHGPSLSS